MEIPTFCQVKCVDETGFFTPEMAAYNDQLNNILRNGLSDNGWTIPTVTAAQLTQIQTFTGDSAPIDGTIWLVTDSTPPELVIQIAGTLNKIATLPYP